MKIPARYGNLLFGGLLSFIMVSIISGSRATGDTRVQSGLSKPLSKRVRNGLADCVSHGTGGGAVC